MSKELQMIQSIETEILKVIELAYNKSQATAEKEDDSINIGSIKKMLSSPYFRARRELTNYLEQLTYEQIQAIQTITYIGRDIEEEYMHLPGEKLFKEYFNRLTWNDKKSIEINQIAEKAKLDRYLIEGCRLLKIDIMKR